MNIDEIRRYLQDTGTEALALDEGGMSFELGASAEDGSWISFPVGIFPLSERLVRFMVGPLIEKPEKGWPALYKKLANDNFDLQLVRLAVTQDNDICLVFDTWFDILNGDRLEEIFEWLVAGATGFIMEYGIDFR